MCCIGAGRRTPRMEAMPSPPLRSSGASCSASNRARQSRGRVCAGARMRRSSLRADSLAVLGLVARRETRYAHYVRCARTIATSQITMRAVARGREPCAPQRRLMSLPTHTHPRLCPHHRAVLRTIRALLRGGWYPGWAISGVASSAGLRAARAARFVRLTRRDCSSGTTAGSEASFSARPQTEQRSGVGAKRRPPQHEPTPGTARRAAPMRRSERPATDR